MKTYAEAAAFLGGRRVRSIPSIRATVVSRLDEHTIAVSYHGTDVVTYHDDETCTLHTGGYHTVTTKSRINDFSPARVYQRNFNWYIMVRCETKPQSFHDGMTVDDNGRPTHDESVKS
jgi:hypothetical protein